MIRNHLEFSNLIINTSGKMASTVVTIQQPSSDRDRASGCCLFWCPPCEVCAVEGKSNVWFSTLCNETSLWACYAILFFNITEIVLYFYIVGCCSAGCWLWSILCVLCPWPISGVIACCCYKWTPTKMNTGLRQDIIMENKIDIFVKLNAFQ